MKQAYSGTYNGLYRIFRVRSRSFKYMIAVVLLVMGSLGARAQRNTIFGLYGGAGWTPTYNYDLGISGGLDFMKEIGDSLYLGADLFYQGYSFEYDNEAYGAKRGTGVAGVTLLNKSSYIFLAPKLAHTIGRGGILKGYVTFAAGFKMSGTEKYRKWDSTSGYQVLNFDSTIATDNNLNSMLFRVGVGLTEALHLGHGKWRFTLTEDFGFLLNSVSKTGDQDNLSPSRTAYSPHKLNPSYISLQIGISHSRR